MDSMEALIARLEAADGETQRRAIFDVLVYLHKNEFITDGPYDRAMELCNVGAFVDAGFVLVPSGLLIGLRDQGAPLGGAQASIYRQGPHQSHLIVARHIGKTRILALFVALAKAIQAQAQTAPVSPETVAQHLPEDMTHD